MAVLIHEKAMSTLDVAHAGGIRKAVAKLHIMRGNVAVAAEAPAGGDVRTAIYKPQVRALVPRFMIQKRPIHRPSNHTRPARAFLRNRSMNILGGRVSGE